MNLAQTKTSMYLTAWERLFLYRVLTNVEVSILRSDDRERYLNLLDKVTAEYTLQMRRDDQKTVTER